MRQPLKRPFHNDLEKCTVVNIVACMSDYRHKRHNVSSLLYHIVCPAKYRRVIFDAEVDMVLKEIC